MKKINQLSIVVLLALVTLSACTMQKRVYNRGFHIEWFESKGSDKVAAVQAKKAEKKQSQKSEQTLTNKTENTANSEDMNMDVKENKTVLSAVEENNNNVSAPKVFFKSNKMAEKMLTKKSNTFAKPMVKAAVKQMSKPNKTADSDLILLYILCLLLPPVAVGIVTDWEGGPLILNIILCLLCWIPGIVHAFIVVSEEG